MSQCPSVFVRLFRTNRIGVSPGSRKWLALSLHRVALAGAIILVAASLIAAGSTAPSYQFATYDAPGWPNSQVWGITNQGMLTGVAYNADATTYTGLVWLDGEPSFVNHPDQGVLGMYLYQANQHGHVTGNYWDVNGIAHAFVYEVARKTFVGLPDIPGATFNGSGGIADNGVTAGAYTTDPKQASNYIGWLYADGKYHDFNATNSVGGTATYCLNNAMTLVGYYGDAAGVTHGYIKPLGKPSFTKDVPVAGAKATAIYGINNADVIAGEYLDAQGNYHGFVMRGGRFTQVDYPGGFDTCILAINDHGDIAGTYYDAAGNAHGFVGRPR